FPERLLKVRLYAGAEALQALAAGLPVPSLAGIELLDALAHGVAVDVDDGDEGVIPGEFGKLPGERAALRGRARLSERMGRRHFQRQGLEAFRVQRFHARAQLAERGLAQRLFAFQ